MTGAEVYGSYDGERNRGADPGVDIYRTDCGRVVYSCTVCVQDYCVFLNLRRQGKRALHYQKL